MPGKIVPPDDLLEFFELAPFVKRWDRFGLPEEELGNLQIEIMSNPLRHPVIKGTRGIRKMRYAPVSWQRGKSGSLRVCYVYFQRLRVVLLTTIYAKNERDDIPAAMKPDLNKAIRDIESELEQIFAKGKIRGKKT